MGKQAFFAQRGTLKKGAMYKETDRTPICLRSPDFTGKGHRQFGIIRNVAMEEDGKDRWTDKKSSEEGMQLTGRTAIADFEPSEKKERRNKRTKKRNWTGHVLREESLSGTEMEGSRPIRGK